MDWRVYSMDGEMVRLERFAPSGRLEYKYVPIEEFESGEKK